jgi:hypothetical protein
MLSLPQAFGGMGSRGLGALEFNTAATCEGWMHDFQGRNTLHANTLASYKTLVANAGVALDALQAEVAAARAAAQSALSSYPQEAAAIRPVAEQIEAAQARLDQAVASVTGTLSQLVALDQAATNVFNCIYGATEHRPYPGVRKHRKGWRNVENHRKVFQQQAADLFAGISATVTAVSRDVKPDFLKADVAAVVARVQAAQAAIAAEAAAAAQAIEDARLAQQQAAADALAAERALEQDRLDREQAVRDADRAFEQSQLDEARRIRDEERAYEAEERNRMAAISQQRMEAELRREQMAIDAEERRLRLQQEAALRAEEREIRAEEREAQLQQLMLIQELAAAGLPTDLLPAGLAPPQKQVQPAPPVAPAGFPRFAPGAMAPGMAPPGPGGQFVLPGFAVPAAGPWSPYGPVVQGPGGPAPMGFAPEVPGFAVQPGFAPVAHAAAPAQPQYQQSSAPVLPTPGVYPQEPQAAAPPGFAWTGFDPGAELFGMGGLGALAQTVNPNLQGALIEERWLVLGPDGSGNYTITRPNGSVFGTFTEDQLFQGALRDPSNNQVVFIPPATRPTGTGSAVATEIAAAVREAIRATGSVLTAQEQRKAAKYGQRYAPPPGQVPPPLATTGKPGVPSALVVGAGMVAAGAVFFAIKSLGKKGEK